MSNQTDLPRVKSYITTHDLEGNSVFLPEPVISEIPLYKPIPPSTSLFADLYQAPTIPVSLDRSSERNDISFTVDLISHNQSPIALPSTGVAFRRVDTPPGGISPMHRTLSIDYAIVVAGSVEAILDSGEKRLLTVGDTLVQRGTMHQWRNPSETEWCRMVFVGLPIEDLVVAGKKLETEFKTPGKTAGN